MQDEWAIQQTLNIYTEGASRADWDQVMSTFLPDGVWSVPALDWNLQGHAAIQPAMAGFTDQMAYWVQTAAPAIIVVDGDRATARANDATSPRQSEKR